MTFNMRDPRVIATSIESADIISRIEYYSERALGTPYVLFSLGEGLLGLYDKDPIVDLTRVDCMTFCEQVLAFSISNNHDEFDSYLKQAVSEDNTEIKKRLLSEAPKHSWYKRTEEMISRIQECMSETYET